MRISDWSSDVCSSDLPAVALIDFDAAQHDRRAAGLDRPRIDEVAALAHPDIRPYAAVGRDFRIFDLLPRTERRGRARDDPFVEGEAEDRKCTRLNSSH